MILPLRYTVLLCFFIFSAFGWNSFSGAEKSAFAYEIDVEKVSWKHLSYRAKSLFGKVTTDVHLMAVPAEQVGDLPITDPAGKDMPPSGETIYTLTVNSNINPLFGSDEMLKTQSWFEPTNAAALRLVRVRKGRQIWQKSYRFHPNGVYHLRKKPVDKKQHELPPEQWTTVEKKFYQYNGQKVECSAVLEPSALLYFVSGIDLSEQKGSLSLCVFDKQQLYRVEINVGGSRKLKVNYLKRSQDKQIRRVRIIDGLKISFQPRSLASPSIAPEAFSFLGLKGDFDIFIDKASNLPVQVSGKISPFGTVDFRLQTVLLNHN